MYLTQSNLTNAFSDELVTTEAELARAEGRQYESAVELLARVRNASECAAAVPRGSGRPSRVVRRRKIPA